MSSRRGNKNTKPFGCLTSTGLRHLEQQGRDTLKAFPALARAKSLEVYSTNYQRTQASAQAFLKGLDAPLGTTVEVRASEECPLSFYDHDPALAVKLTKQVQSSATFRREEEGFVDSHGGTLLSAVPELGNARDVFTFNVPINDPSITTMKDDAIDGDSQLKTKEQKRKESGNGEKKINWMAALDYFSCRGAHELPIHPELEDVEIAKRTQEYVGSRFKLYYADNEFRRLAVLPMMRNVIVKEFNHRLSVLKTCVSEDCYSPSVVIYSGHDVNLLGLLVAMNASLIQNNSSHWPDYGASLVFELVHEDRGGTGTIESDKGVSADDCLVNVYYNQQPLLIELPSTGTGTVTDADGGHAIRLSDLVAFCDSLTKV